MALSAIFALTTALVGPAARADAPADMTLAIVAFEPRGDATVDDASTVADIFTGSLVNDGKLRVVERGQLARVMKEQALAASGVMSDQNQVKVAQLVGARWILLGSLAASGRSFVITARAVDSSSGQVAFLDTAKVGSPDQLPAGARQLARKLQDKLTGSATASASGHESVGDFDPSMVKEAARQLAHLLAARFPQTTGKLREVLPSGTSSCAFADPRAAFVNERFNITGVDSVTSQTIEKGIFLLKVIDEKGGCSGRYKSAGHDEISDNDSIVSLPLKVWMDPLQLGVGMDPEVGRIFSEETRESLKSHGAFELTQEAQVQLVGRMSGGRGHRAIEIQAIEKGGAIIQRWDLTAQFER